MVRGRGPWACLGYRRGSTRFGPKASGTTTTDMEAVEDVARAPPLPETAFFAMVGWSFFHGHVGFGISLLLGFYGMLRTGELLGLKSNDMSMSGPKSVAVISLGLTKSGKRVGAAESVTITAGPALKWLWQWKEKNKPKTFLCPKDHEWRRLFKACLDALLTLFEFRPYSLRRGGATFWFGKRGNLDKLLVVGRWQAAKTARIYINEGLAVLNELRLPSKALLPFTRVFHNRTSLPPAHLSKRGRRSKRGTWKEERGGAVFSFSFTDSF